jgi:type VII secretion-associated serine protease mycosin
VPVVALLMVAGVAGPVPVDQPRAYAQPPAPDQPAAHDPHDQLAPLAADQAWRHSTGTGVVVAVLDSGVDAGHPDLAGRVLPGRDYVDGSTDGRVDPVGHGTTVASLVAGGGDPATGLAPDAQILPVRVLDEQNRYQRASTVADGVVWAVDQGAQVINLSLGGSRASGSLAGALAYAMAHDVVLVACTGNATGDYPGVWYPAREPGVVAVSGLTFSGLTPVKWPESLTGPETVLAAPAVMTGARSGGGHRRVEGTSFSSALVAGTAALIRSRWPGLSAGEVVNRLVATADHLGAPGRNPVFGFGAVDPLGALTEPVPQVRGNPLDTRARSRATGFGPAPDHTGPLTAPPQAAPAPGGEPARQPAGVAGDEATGRASGPGGAAMVWVLLGFTGLLVSAAALRVGWVARVGRARSRPG